MTHSTSDRDYSPFRHDGSDVGVLLCHGFPGAPGSMRGWADHLVAAGYSVRLPLLPGHGTRWQDANRTTFDDWLAEVTREFQELTSTCRAVVVCGLSMGGTLTLRLAELYPDAMAGIVLVNPSVLTLRVGRQVGAALVCPMCPRPTPASSGTSRSRGSPNPATSTSRRRRRTRCPRRGRWCAGICRRSPRRCCCCTRRSITPLNR